MMATSELVVPVNGEDHVQGPESARVTLVEYADYECPYSRRASHVVRGLRNKSGDRLRFAYRHFPLTHVHPHAFRAAEAAEAAGAQGQFWEMHQMLFDRQRALEDEDIIGYAAELGLDAERMRRELAEDRYADDVRDDVASGKRSGVHATPTFFINGVHYGGESDLNSLLAAIEAAEAGEQRKGRRRR